MSIATLFNECLDEDDAELDELAEEDPPTADMLDEYVENLEKEIFRPLSPSLSISPSCKEDAELDDDNEEELDDEDPPTADNLEEDDEDLEGEN
jgi:hypothetical protein